MECCAALVVVCVACDQRFAFSENTTGTIWCAFQRELADWRLTGLETNARPRRVKFRPGEWFVRPDQPGGRVGILRGFIDHIMIASLALISSGLSRQNKILNRIRLF